ncbi:MAG: hypothetical protein B7733_15195 [Myxococcales bacterium FL481]|nr:MAG: hypothetical protein B7733_15195 [Myxococcales bacterium FL481]
MADNPRRPLLVVHGWFVWLLMSTCSSVATEDTRPPLGLDAATSEDLAGGPQVAFVDPTLEQVRQRGLELCRLERLWALAHNVGLSRAPAGPQSGMLVPLVSLDAAGRSGEAVFYRWPEPVEAGRPDPLQATRWLVVPILFEPERVLDSELFSDRVERGDAAHRKLEAFLVAASTARARVPAGSWRIYASFREYEPDGARRLEQTRVYLFGNESAPDLEIVVRDAARREPAHAVSVELVHTAAQRQAEPLGVTGASPSPMTVCRALSRDSPRVRVVTTSGGRWQIDTGDGRLRVVE